MDIKLDIGGPGSEAVKELAAGGRGALRRAFGPALTEFGGMLSDQVKFWRFNNLVRIREKVDRVANERAVPDKLFNALPFGDAMRTLEAASQEDEDDVQELWARLVVKAATESSTPSINKLHIEILRSLSPADTALLELLFPSVSGRMFYSLEEVAEFNDEMNAKAEGKWRKFSEGTRDVSVQNLIRLRCITATPRVLRADHVLRSVNIRNLNLRGAVVDPREFQNLLTELIQLIYQGSGVIPYDTSSPVPLHSQTPLGYREFGQLNVPELNHMLTPLGTEFMKAVTLDGKAQLDH